MENTMKTSETILTTKNVVIGSAALVAAFGLGYLTKTLMSRQSADAKELEKLLASKADKYDKIIKLNELSMALQEEKKALEAELTNIESNLVKAKDAAKENLLLAKKEAESLIVKKKEELNAINIKMAEFL